MAKNLIILPVFERAGTIRDQVNTIVESLGNQTDIVVVDDGSEDDTSSRVQTNDRLKLITHGITLGYGACVISGLRLAIDNEYDYAVTLDVGIKGCHYAFTPIIASLAEGNDIVTLSRMLLEDRSVSTQDYATLDTGSVVADTLNQNTGYSHIDPFSPFKGFRVKTASILELEEYDEAAIIQLWIQSAHHSLKVKEITCDEIHTGYIHEGEYLENDIDHYLAFIEAERILYPVEIKEN